MANYDEDLEVYRIPGNYKTSGTFRNLKIPNLVEGILTIAPIDFMIFNMSVTGLYRTTLLLLVSLILGVIFINGFHGTTIYRFAFNAITFAIKRKKYSMRKIGDNDVETFADRISTGEEEVSETKTRIPTLFKKIHKEKSS